MKYCHSVEPVTLRKHVAEYEQMWKWMVEFLSKYQGHGINSIRVDKSMIFLNILRAIVPWVTSSCAIALFALSFRQFPLIYILYFRQSHTVEYRVTKIIPQGYLKGSGKIYICATKAPRATLNGTYGTASTPWSGCIALHLIWYRLQDTAADQRCAMIHSSLPYS